MMVIMDCNSKAKANISMPPHLDGLPSKPFFFLTRARQRNGVSRGIPSVRLCTVRTTGNRIVDCHLKMHTGVLGLGSDTTENETNSITSSLGCLGSCYVVEYYLPAKRC
jgi:hypothetical protein